MRPTSSRRAVDALVAWILFAAVGAGCGGDRVGAPADGAGGTVTTPRASSRLVFAHYFTPYPISIDNKDGTTSSDYYATGYNNPAGENGIHAAYGGMFRDRPLPRTPLSGDWQLQDMETEVRRARAAGLDGFTVDVLSLTSYNWTRLQTLITAANTVDATFRIVPMPDATASDVSDVNALAAAIASLASNPSVFHLSDGRLVLSAFAPEKLGVSYWSQLISLLDGKGIQVAFVPCFLNLADAAAFAPISYGFSDWGNRSPAEQTNQASHAKLAHSYGKIWMQPVSAQDERPDQHIYDEANDTENLRTCAAAAAPRATTSRS